MRTVRFSDRQLKKIFSENDVSFVGIFGSVSRSENTTDSDIDLLVKFSKRKGLLAVIKLERELSKYFGKKVDLLTESAISPYLRDHILNDIKVVYEKK